MKGGRVIFRFRFCLKCLIEQLCEQTKRFNIVVVSYTRVLITSTYHSSHTHTHTHTHTTSPVPVHTVPALGNKEQVHLLVLLPFIFFYCLLLCIKFKLKYSRLLHIHSMVSRWGRLRIFNSLKLFF